MNHETYQVSSKISQDNVIHSNILLIASYTGDKEKKSMLINFDREVKVIECL